MADMIVSGGNNSAAPGISSPGDWFNNAFTGNIDFARQKYLMDYQLGANTAMQNRDFAFYSAEAKKNRDFQDEQSRTQYLRAADQLRQLGLNPAVLAYGNASVASSASGSSSSGGSHHFSGGSWQRMDGRAMEGVLRLVSSLANVAALAFA